MKFDENFLKVLYNFSNINKNILFPKGNVISTVSESSNSLVARIDLDFELPKTFGIFDLPRFLSVLNLMKDADLDFQDTKIKIYNDTSECYYKYTAINQIKIPKSNKIVLPSIDMEFDITSEQLQTVLKAAQTMRLKFIGFISDKSSLKFSAFEKEEMDGDRFEIELDKKCSKKMNIIINIDDMKIINQDYHVKISKRKVLELTGGPLTYWIAPDIDSIID